MGCPPFPLPPSPQRLPPSVSDGGWGGLWVLPSLEVDAPSALTGLRVRCHDQGLGRPPGPSLWLSPCVHLALPLPWKNSCSCGPDTPSGPGDLGHWTITASWPEGQGLGVSRGWALCGADCSLLGPSWDLVAPSVSSVLPVFLPPPRSPVTQRLGSQNRPRGAGWAAHGTSILERTGLCEGCH